MILADARVLTSSSVASGQRIGALVSFSAMLIAACLLLPIFSRPLAVVPFFLPLYLALVAFLAAATAALLLVRARVDEDVALAILAAAYVAAVPLLLVAAVTLPGSVASRGVTAVGLTIAGYCLTVWRLALPLGFLGFALLSRRHTKLPLWLPSAIVLAVATLLPIAVSIASPGRLPAMQQAGHFSAFHQVLTATSTILDILAVILLLRLSRPTTIERWAVVAAMAAAFEALLSVHMSERFSVGWYGSRAFALFGGAAMFGAVAARAGRVALSIYEKLRAEEALRTLAETIPQIVWTALPNGEIDWANKRWLDFTGMTTVDTREWRQALHRGDLAALARRWPQLLAAGNGFELELRIRDRHGRFRWFLTRVEPMRDDRGRVVRWYGTSTDVDDQRRQATRVKELYAREHRIAVNLQTAFLPANFPRSPGLGFSHVYLPASQEENVGGDWYDAFRVGERRIAVCVGDVSGHGLEAAVRMIRVRELVRAAAFYDALPSIVLERAASALDGDHPEQLVTVLYGIFDSVQHTFTYASAGHPPPAVLRDGSARVLTYGGIPLGVEANPSYDDHALALLEGDIIALYSDGLTESLRDPLEGERRLLAMLESGIVDAGALAVELVPKEQRDDVAIATIAIGPLQLGALPQHDWKFHASDVRLARGARASCALYLSACGLDASDLALAELALGELIGNVVRYAPGSLDIEVTWRDGSPLLSVADRGIAGFPDVWRTAPRGLAESGRGFTMLGELGMPPFVRPRPGGGTEVIVALPCSSLAL